MNRKQRPHRRGLAQDEQKQSRQAHEKQQHEERHVHSGLTVAGQCRIAPFLEPEQTRRPDQQSDAAQRAQHNGQTPEQIWRGPAQHIVINGRDARGGEARHEAVERQVMKPPARIRRLVVGIGTAITAATEINEPCRIVDRFCKRPRT